jgi:hypothetical protein
MSLAPRHLAARARALAFGLAAVIPLALAPAASAGENACGLTGVPRVVAVGDVHGAYDNLVQVLRMASLLDESGHWAGFKAHLVLVGDFLDRGVQARQVLDLLMRLEKEAGRAGGRVHVLLGNHEVMNILGDLRYVRTEEYEAYQTPESGARREQFLRSTTERARLAAKAAGTPWDEGAFREQLLKQTPLGFVERTEALSARGEYGRWIRERDPVALINGVVFVHGGLTPEVAALGCKGINERVHRDLDQDLARTLENPLATLAAGAKGPLWYRGLALDDEVKLLPGVEKVLQSMGATAVVVGHTTEKDGRVHTRFGGRVVMIDVGMVPELGGHLAALEVGADGAMTVIYPAGREPLERKAAGIPQNAGPGAARAGSF